MTTRFTAKGRLNYGVEPLATGFGGVIDPESTVPSVGLEDVDVALFNLFEKEIKLQVSGNDENGTVKVPTIFAAGEKWAMLKRGQMLRDKKNSLILPLVTIVRTNKVQSLAEDVSGRGINQHTGELVIQRRLGTTDRSYQRLANKLYVRGQRNVAVGTNEAQDCLRTRRTIGALENDPMTSNGRKLASNNKKNVVETIVIPSPQFYTATYEVTVWTQYMQQMNQIIEQLMSSFLMQCQGWRIETQAGYWFVAKVDGESFNSETNVEDMSQEERVIKHKFTVNVPAYVLATSTPGGRLAVKRYVSDPEIEFTVSVEDPDTLIDPNLGSDDPTLPMTTSRSKRADQRETGKGRVFSSTNEGVVDPNDPALRTYPRGMDPARYKKFVIDGEVRYLRIKNTNVATGEQVFSGTDLGSFSFVVVDE